MCRSLDAAPATARGPGPRDCVDDSEDTDHPQILIHELQASRSLDLSPELLEKPSIDRHELGFLRPRVAVLMSSKKQNRTQGRSAAGSQDAVRGAVRGEFSAIDRRRHCSVCLGGREAGNSSWGPVAVFYLPTHKSCFLNL